MYLSALENYDYYYTPPSICQVKATFATEQKSIYKVIVNPEYMQLPLPLYCIILQKINNQFHKFLFRHVSFGNSVIQ